MFNALIDKNIEFLYSLSMITHKKQDDYMNTLSKHPALL